MKEQITELKDEFEELLNKIYTLERKLKSEYGRINEEFKLEIGDVQYALLECQLGAMRNYALTLRLRIQNYDPRFDE